MLHKQYGKGSIMIRYHTRYHIKITTLWMSQLVNSKDWVAQGIKNAAILLALRLLQR
jgi:hypothetical protein